MSGSILWKLGLSAVVLFWSVASLIPPRDTPFEEYALEAVGAEQEEFETLLNEAQALVEAETEPSTFTALRTVANEGAIDLSRFFPQYNLAGVPNLERRNSIVVNTLLRRSRGELKLGLDLQGGVGVTFRLDAAELEGLREWERTNLINEAVRVLQQRVDAFGIAEPVIRPVGNERIELQLPGVSTKENPDLLTTINKPAKLEFRRVARPSEVPGLDPRTAEAEEVPPRFEIMVIEDEDPETGETIRRPYFVERRPMATGEIISNARPEMDQVGNYQVSLNFTGEGAKRFAQMTRQIAENNTPNNIGQLAIVLDGTLESAPTVREEIIGGRAQISGDFTRADALELSNILNNPLAVEMEVEETYEVQATLAEDAADASVNAALLGGILVVIFMVVYYLFGGIVAVISAVCNVTIVIGVLCALDATLTLPGVAALVLTLGMGVDANILIFERIREELKAGKQLRSAVIGGFDKAFSTIIDANVTTLLTAVILIAFGAGPVKGFGFTLAIGIGSSVFCALVLTRALFEIVINHNLLKKVLGMPGLGIEGINFMKFRAPAFAASWLIVIPIGIIAVVMHWDEIWGIDFTGGDRVTLSFTERLDITEIEEVAQDQKLGEVNPLYQTDLGSGEERLRLETDLGQAREVLASLQAVYPQAGLQEESFTQIGASVSRGIQLNALYSVVFALGGILLYVAFRFEVGFGIGAVVATIHDILLTIGIYVALGEFLGVGSGQFTSEMLAAILMIVGYSINDTIVLFDRIREELQLKPGMRLFQIVNLSINRVLNRTILTSITTLLAAFSLFIFGAGVINDFALVFILGILTGTFSSIFIASPVFYWWHKGDRRHVEEREILPKYEWDASSKAAETNAPATS